MGTEAFRKARAAIVSAGLAKRSETRETAPVSDKKADAKEPVQPVLPLAPPAAVPAQPTGPSAEDFERLRAKSAELETALAKSAADLEAARQERARIAEQNNRERIRFTALNLAERAGAISAEQVVKLLGDELTLTEKGEVVLTSDPKIGAEAHIKAFLETNAHFRKPQVHAGSGAQPFPATAPGGGTKPDLTTDAGLTTYARQLTHQAVSSTATPTATRGPGSVN